jgi:hypothetical protein
MGEYRALGIVELRMGARPEILIRCNRNRLVDRLGVKTGRLVPEPGLVGALPVAPEKASSRNRVGNF